MYIIQELFIFSNVLTSLLHGHPTGNNDGGSIYQMNNMILPMKVKREFVSYPCGLTNGATGWCYNNQFINHEWPNNTIPYSFHPQVPEKKVMMIKSSMEDVMNAVPNCWKFVPRVHESHWVEFNTILEPNACTAAVGNQVAYGKSPQYANFGADYCKHGKIVHELFHILGFLHEQTRNDRDEFVTVHMDRIPEYLQYNYKRDEELLYVTTNYNIPYNFESIMHYSFNQSASIVITNPIMANKRNTEAWSWDFPDHAVGQRSYISTGDLYLMARRGKCGDPDPTKYCYPITGAEPSPYCRPNDPQFKCYSMKCSKVKQSCPVGEKTKRIKCTDKGQNEMYKTLCCQSYNVITKH